MVCAAKRSQICGSLVPVDDGRWIAQADQEEIEDQTTGSSVTVKERMDLLESAVDRRDLLRELRRPGPETVCVVEPILRLRWYLDPCWWSHASREELDIVLSKGAWCFQGRGLRMRLDVPDRGHGHLVDSTNLGEGHMAAVRPVPWLDRLTVDPFGSVVAISDSSRRQRYDLKLWIGSLRESATYPPA